MVVNGTSITSSPAFAMAMSSGPNPSMAFPNRLPALSFSGFASGNEFTRQTDHSHHHDEHHEDDEEEAHGHGHHDHGRHGHAPANIAEAFAIGIALNILYTLAEAFYGVRADSLALLADAGHNLGDVLGLEHFLI
jgi:hypothetical protein